MTPQERIKAKMLESGIPVKEINVFGSHIIVTAWSQTAARKWAMLISRFAKVQKVAGDPECC